MNDTPGIVPPEQKVGTGPQTEAGASGQYETWSALLNQLVETGSDLGKLFTLELQLALGDARRMFFLLLLVVPFVLLAWVSFCALVSWLFIDYSQSISVGLLVFLVQQLAIIRYIQSLWRRYSQSLTLPMTRQHLHSLIDITRKGDLRHNDSHPPGP